MRPLQERRSERLSGDGWGEPEWECRGKLVYTSQIPHSDPMFFTGIRQRIVRGPPLTEIRSARHLQGSSPPEHNTGRGGVLDAHQVSAVCLATEPPLFSKHGHFDDAVQSVSRYSGRRRRTPDQILQFRKQLFEVRTQSEFIE